MSMPAPVFLAGGTGYLGRALIEALLRRGHRVRGLIRPGSASRLPAGAEAVTGDALNTDSYLAGLQPGDTLVHLVGTPRPSPAKAASFRSVDLVSIRAAAEAAGRVPIRHLVYVSVAQPAPVMRAYVAARQEGERLVRDAGVPATILRPWYVLGPGHRWPMLLLPVYAVARLIPATRAGAERLGMVTRQTMVAALMRAIHHPPAGVRVVEVSEIRGALK